MSSEVWRISHHKLFDEFTLLINSPVVLMFFGMFNQMLTMTPDAIINAAGSKIVVLVQGFGFVSFTASLII